MPCSMNQGNDHDGFFLFFDRVDDLVGEFFRISPTDISAGMFFTTEQGIDRQIGPHIQNLIGKPYPEPLELLLIPIPCLLQIGIKLGENDNFPIHRENLVRILSAMVSAATALAGSV